MKIQDLLDYSTPGVWGFFNDKDKRFFISYSNNILSAVSRNIAQIQDKTHTCRKLIRDLPHLNFILLARSNQDTKDLKLLAVELSDSFKAKGYTPYNSKLLVSYKLRTVITTDYKIHVLLVNKRNDKIVVGVFDNIDDSKSFISINYPNNKITKVIYSDNSLTKEFYNERKEVKV
jgi:hypothetical protein